MQAHEVDEKTRDGIKRWLKSRGISIGKRDDDTTVVEALWQEVCDALYLHANGNPKFDSDGVVLDDQGNRSIFDDVDAQRESPLGERL